MSIRIYNSLTKKKENFEPLEGKKVRMYSCGVTVYDQCHIGHARSLYVFEVIRRYLTYRGYDVHFVRNITDIDDKIINKAKETHKDSKVVAEENIKDYYRDMKSLGIDPADHEPKATENIPEMIKYISVLIDSNFAYEADGDVYFAVREFKEYGKLSGQSIEKMLDAVRIEADPKKKDPLDFVLWKSSSDDEPGWDSPWGRGRPGWHTECTCMSMKYLDTQTLDIHAGGRDLIFPHHENEIAQSEAVTKKPFAKYWIHHGLLTINGQKMAKSVGNFITIADAIAKHGVDPLKMLYLASHYGSPVDFSDQKMEDSRKALQRFAVLFQKERQAMARETLSEEHLPEFIHARKKEFEDAMDDDFNTPRALAALFELVNDTNRYVDDSIDQKIITGVVWAAAEIIRNFGHQIFGLFEHEDTSQEVDLETQKILDERAQARMDKEFERSDELRNVLMDKGIIVEDTPAGQVWRHK